MRFCSKCFKIHHLKNCNFWTTQYVTISESESERIFDEVIGKLVVSGLR